MKRLVVLSGAGMSAESGIATFRDKGGLWEGHKVEEVASPMAWDENPAKVLRFYNKRRELLKKSKPNKGHTVLAELETDYDITVITQNIDNLHELAGSSNVLHLHGQLTQARSIGTGKVYDIGYKALELGDLCEEGYQLRPHIVWFGEDVPMLYNAIEYVEKADILLIIGTSLQVYPAAGLMDYAPPSCPIYLIDPRPKINSVSTKLTIIAKKASEGLLELRTLLKNLQ